MKTIFKKFFEKVKKWHADQKDFKNLSIIADKIGDLKSILCGEIDLIERRNIITEMDMWSRAHRTTLCRIKDREVRHKRTAKQTWA